MLKTLDFLRSGKSIKDLENEYGIVSTFHDSLPICILNYHQIDSPKTEKIVKECRNLIIDTESLTLISRSFLRFYNWGEVQEEMSEFHWESAIVEEKVDGSLLNFFYYDNNWHVATRGSFANGPILNKWQAQRFQMPETFTWKDAILKTLNCTNLNELNLDKSITYVCEFCSLWNKVVKKHPKPFISLLTCFSGETEIGVQPSPFQNIKTYNLITPEDIKTYVDSQPDDTFEGCVVKDKEYRRWKIKNKRYLMYHKIKGNGDALYLPSTLLPYILTGEEGELLSTYEEVTECFNSYKEKVSNAYKELETLYNSTKHIVDQKDFALSIVKHTPFSSILFTTRKTNAHLKDIWRKSENIILKVLFK